MAPSKIHNELIQMLNQALRLEYSARIQYLVHAESVKGLYAESVIERLKEIAGDEEKHEGIFRTLIASYLDGKPVMELAPTHPAKSIKEILTINLKDERDAVDLYKKIYAFVISNKEAFPYCFERLEHDIRHVILDEQEHAVELSALIDFSE